MVCGDLKPHSRNRMPFQDVSASSAAARATLFVTPPWAKFSCRRRVCAQNLRSSILSAIRIFRQSCSESRIPGGFELLHGIERPRWPN